MTTEQERAEVNKSIAEKFVESVSGTELPQDKIDAAVKMLTGAPAASYSASMTWMAAIFYLQIRIDWGGKQFNGIAAGIRAAGSGGMSGEIYTDAVDRLYRTTSAFTYIVTPVYFVVNFFDAHSNFLGHFLAGATAMAPGTGTGMGSWR